MTKTENVGRDQAHPAASHGYNTRRTRGEKYPSGRHLFARMYAGNDGRPEKARMAETARSNFFVGGLRGPLVEQRRSRGVRGLAAANRKQRSGDEIERIWYLDVTFGVSTPHVS